MSTLLNNAIQRSKAWQGRCTALQAGLVPLRPLSTWSRQPLSVLRLFLGTGLVLTGAACVLYQARQDASSQHLWTHLDSLIKDKSGQMQASSDPSQTASGSVVTPLTCLFIWGNNRYRVADPNSSRLHVPFPTPLFLDSAVSFDEKEATPDASDLSKLCRLYGSRVRSVALSEKHAAAIDGKGNLFQWGTGFFGLSKSLQGKTAHNDEPSGLMALVHHDTAHPKSPSTSTMQAEPSSPNRLDNRSDFRPTCTLSGKNLAQVVCTLDYAFAMSDQNELWMLPALLPAVEAGKELVTPIKIPLPFAKDEKLLKLAAGDTHLLLLTDKGSVYSTPVTTSGNFYGQCGVGPNPTREQPSDRLLDSLPSYHVPLSMKDPVDKQLKPAHAHQERHLEQPVAKPLPFLPVSKVELVEKASDIACGSHHSLLLGADSNAVYGFGSNLSFQLGIAFLPHSFGPNSSSSKQTADACAPMRPVRLDLVIGTAKESVDPFVGFVVTEQTASSGHREHYTKYATGSPESTSASLGGLAPTSSHVAHPDEVKERFRSVRFPLSQQFKIERIYAGGLNSGFLARNVASGQDALFVCGQGLQGQFGDSHIRHAQPELGQVKLLGTTKYYDEASHMFKAVPISAVSFGKSHMGASLAAHGVDHVLDSRALKSSKISLPRFGSSLFMWGSNMHYNLGNGRRATSYVPIQPLSFPFVHDDYELYLEREKPSSQEDSSQTAASLLTLEQLFRRYHHPHHATNLVHDVGLQLFPGVYRQVDQTHREEILPAQKFVCGHDTSAIY